MHEFYQFYLPTKIVFEVGIAKDFSSELQALGVQRYFIITDSFLHKSGLLDPIIQGITANGFGVVGIFDQVPPNSEVKVVEACAKAANAQHAEGIIAIGGGSVLDTAKAANILFTLGGSLVDDYSGAQTITSTLNPFVAIPTTSGTGSEVTSAAVIYDEATSRKLSFTDDHLYPRLAILDPELTLGMPAKLTAMTGMDALTHAVEAITSVQKNAMSDALAKKAIVLIKENLAAAIQDGKNLEARSAMVIASNLAGIAFDHAMVGVVHAMAHATGGIAHVPHGLANSILLPYGMEYNLNVAQDEYASLASLFGKASAAEAIEEIFKLRKKVSEAAGIPMRLRDAGVKAEQLATIAQVAVEDGASFYNPREVELDGVLEKIKAAF